LVINACSDTGSAAAAGAVGDGFGVVDGGADDGGVADGGAEDGEAEGVPVAVGGAELLASQPTSAVSPSASTPADQRPR
jgi:hypothetical protein